MKYCRRLMICFLMLIPIAGFAHLPTSQEGNSIAPMLAKVTPAIVNIYVEGEQLTRVDQLLPERGEDGRKVPVKSFAVGSGVIFDAAKGLIVTNAHVISNEKVIVVTLKNGERYHAKLIAKDTGYDIAILAIKAKNLTGLPFANSDNLKVGDFVTAIGSPYGLSQTVTSGVVSALNRTHPQIEGYQSFIQTDAPINPGNSGGALVNMQGELVGINTAMVAPTDGNIGIGFSIPSNMVQGVIDQLIKYGKVEHSVLGVIAENITPQLADAVGLSNTHGAIISQVLPNTPAAIAGLKAEDVITQVNNHPVSSAVQLRNIMGLIRPKSTVHITYLRNHETKTMTATVVNPKEIKEPTTAYFSGMRLQNFKEQEIDGIELQGVLITDIKDSSEGALAGFALGDVITAVNSTPVTSLEALQNAIKNQTKPIMLSVMRGNNNLFV